MSTTNTTGTITIKSNEKYQIKLVDNPTTGYTWDYVCDHPDTTKEIEREVVRNSNLMGAPSTLTITFQSSKSDTIKFYHIRKWLNQKLSDLTPNYTQNVVIN